MAYVKPTRDDFLERFPIFGDKDPAAIDAMLDEAARTVDTSWIEADYAPAIMYLAAHLLATDNSEEGDEVEIGRGQAGITSESFGGMSISYTDTASANDAAANSQYGSTEYGRRFYRLLKLNKTGPVVVP